MIRRSVAGAVLGISLLMGSFAWSGFVALRTVFDSDRSREVAEELLDNEQVREQLAENTSFAVRSIIPSQVPVEDALIDQVTAELLNNPAVEEIILGAFADTHAAFLGEGDAPESINLTELAEVARSSLVGAAPELDGVVPASPILSVPLPTEHVPDASPVSDVLDKAVPLLAGLAGLGALLALIATNDRPAILRRAGFWALGTTAVYLIIGIGIPFLLRQYAPEQAEVLAALLAALLRSTLLPSIVLGATGIALLGLAGLWSAAAGRGGAGARRAKSRRAPGSDAPHRRKVASMASSDSARQDPPVERGGGTPDPYGRPESNRPARPRQRRPATQPQQMREQPNPGAGRQPTPELAQLLPAEEVAGGRDDAGVPVPVSPYPDAAHHRSTHSVAPEAAETPLPGAERPMPRSPHSIFGDVPSPQGAQPATRPAAPGSSVPEPQALTSPQPTDTSRSVFASPAADVAPAEAVVPASSAPPAGARWHAEHGWVLDPESAEPLPVDALWVEGIGHVVRPSSQE